MTQMHFFEFPNEHETWKTEGQSVVKSVVLLMLRYAHSAVCILGTDHVFFSIIEHK